MPGRSGKEKENLNAALFFVLWMGVFILDQGTKSFISRDLSSGISRPVLAGFFDLVLVHNSGTAFGFLKGAEVFLVVSCVLSVFFLIFLYFRYGRSLLWRISLGLILGGAFGNLSDRARLGYVIDFLDLHAGPYHWPAFNLADSAITVGTILLAIGLLKKAGHSPHDTLNIKQ